MSELFAVLATGTQVYTGACTIITVILNTEGGSGGNEEEPTSIYDVVGDYGYSPPSESKVLDLALGPFKSTRNFRTPGGLFPKTKFYKNLNWPISNGIYIVKGGLSSATFHVTVIYETS